MAAISLSGVGKVYPDGTRAVAALDLQIADGELMVIVGPSGCGKSTTLRMTAGLEEISEGEIHIGERLVNKLDPRERDVAMVFQNYALYPHMSVFDNLAFPLRAQRVPKAEVRIRVERTAALLGLDGFLKRKPRSLSGGQRQRVAMGRAIVREPKVFLMDEPLSNLDAKLRTQLRRELTSLQRELGVTTMYVTHDQTEAMTMGTRIAVMRDGVLQQHGSPQQLYDKPDNLFVAAFLGSPEMNLLHGRIERTGDTISCVLGDERLPIALSPGAITALTAFNGAAVAVGVRPEHLSDPSLAHRDLPRLRGRAVSVEFVGAEQLVQLELEVPAIAQELLVTARDFDTIAADSLSRGSSRRAVVTAQFAPHTRVRSNEPVEVAVATNHLHFFDLTTGLAIR